MLKVKIEMLCKDENFVQDFIRYETVREQCKRLSNAISAIRELTPPERLETAVDLSPAEVNFGRLRKMEQAHSELLDDLYGTTWQDYDTAVEILSKKGRI
jgi:hypothetical protein